jgi:hypothetical protein
MTPEEFNARYKILKQIAQDPGRSFTAQETASGRAVLVHFLADDLIPPGSQFRDLMGRLSSRDRSKVLDILSVGSSTVVVTQFLEDFETFGLWLQSRLDGGRPPVPSPEPAAPVGDFTKLFQQGSSAEPVLPPAAPIARPQRDSFTELFETPSEPMPHFRPPAPATPPVEILRVRLPASDPVPPAAPAPPPLPKPSWPGSFDPPKAPAPVAPLPSPMLGSQTPPPVAPAPVIRPPALGPLPPPAPLPNWSGESDYTRQLSPAPAPIDAAPPLPSPPPPLDAASGAKEGPGSAPASQSIVPLLLVLNIVVIIATGVILYFALKKS